MTFQCLKAFDSFQTYDTYIQTDTRGMEQATDRSLTAAVDGLISSPTENILV